MGIFELTHLQTETDSGTPPKHRELGSVFLVQNVRWFIRVRWIVLTIFALAGLSGVIFKGQLYDSGFDIPSLELWILALSLTVLNFLFLLSGRKFNEKSPLRTVNINIWLQIISDLIVVTGLVHITGSTSTFIAFVYLFHITLSCIFFPKRDSLIVTLVSIVLYLSTIGLEILNILPPANFLIEDGMKQDNFIFSFLFGLSAVFVWVVVWYFVSTLSEAVRNRDQRLSEVNERLMASDREINQQMLVTTHDLKAPFAGIESNIQVLKYQYWEQTPLDIRKIIERIDLRAQTLRERINDILTLGNLKSREVDQEKLHPVDLNEIMNKVLEEVKEKAESRCIDIKNEVPSITVLGDKDQFIILFLNLISNAVNYSRDGGEVNISVRIDTTSVNVFIRDQGIGIREDALPHIFDDYFRTNEAAQYNKFSTGLGLSIVKVIVRNFRLTIRVKSEEDKGTEFEVAIPRSIT